MTRAANSFAEDWGGPVTITLSPYGTDNRPGLSLTAALWAERSAIGVRKPLASASVSMEAGSAGDISTAALSVLYELDKEIYRREIGVSAIRA